MTALTAKCVNPIKDDARFLSNGLADLQKNGVTDEDFLSLAEHLAGSIPDGVQVECAGVLAAYVLLREG